MKYSPVISCLTLFPCLLIAFNFRYFPLSRVIAFRSNQKLFSSNQDENFDGKEFEAALKSMGPLWDKKLSSADNSVLNSIRDDQIAKAEEIYRDYPFEHTALPLLPDCNNYYSGKFGEYFWHQNADQVYVYIPIDEDVTRKDIDATFEARKVVVKIKGKDEISFQCLERIIPDGSFWVIEVDKDGKRYIQLDLEKRFRMINWKSLFGEPREEEAQALEDRAQMLDKLFAANKGMSKLTGSPAETKNEMMSNADLVKMISSKIYDTPQVAGEGAPWSGEDVDVEPISREDFDLNESENDSDSGNSSNDSNDFIDVESE